MLAYTLPLKQERCHQYIQCTCIHKARGLLCLTCLIGFLKECLKLKHKVTNLISYFFFQEKTGFFYTSLFHLLSSLKFLIIKFCAYF